MSQSEWSLDENRERPRKTEFRLFCFFKFQFLVPFRDESPPPPAASGAAAPAPKRPTSRPKEATPAEGRKRGVPAAALELKVERQNSYFVVPFLHQWTLQSSYIVCR